MKFLMGKIAVILFIIVQISAAENDENTITQGTEYASKIRPKFYNTTTLPDSDEIIIRNWIRWKNQMPRFGFYLNYVNLIMILDFR